MVAGHRWVTLLVFALVVVFAVLLASTSNIINYFGAAITIVLVCVGAVLLLEIFAPSITANAESNNSQTKTAAHVSISTALILVFVFCVGRFNYMFLDCQHFLYAGLYQPNNCKVRS
jgi:thiol:disulfide interchange protein